MAGGVVWRPLLAGAWLLWLLPWASAVHRSDFPAAFLFGTATSSYQVITLDLHFFFLTLISSSLPQPFGHEMESGWGILSPSVDLRKKKLLAHTDFLEK